MIDGGCYTEDLHAQMLVEIAEDARNGRTGSVFFLDGIVENPQRNIVLKRIWKWEHLKTLEHHSKALLGSK